MPFFDLFVPWLRKPKAAVKVDTPTIVYKLSGRVMIAIIDHYTGDHIGDLLVDFPHSIVRCDADYVTFQVTRRVKDLVYYAKAARARAAASTEPEGVPVRRP